MPPSSRQRGGRAPRAARIRTAEALGSPRRLDLRPRKLPGAPQDSIFARGSSREPRTTRSSSARAPGSPSRCAFRPAGAPGSPACVAFGPAEAPGSRSGLDLRSAKAPGSPGRLDFRPRELPGAQSGANPRGAGADRPLTPDCVGANRLRGGCCSRRSSFQSPHSLRRPYHLQ